MTRLELPIQGQNLLTRRLLAQGVRMDDSSTWPENVWMSDQNNFEYKHDWKYTPTWESPCGLLIHSHGDSWGDTWVNGEHKCAENDNPLFGCPMPGKPCPHRLKLPAGINCQFHRTDREWNEEGSVEELERQRRERFRELREADMRRYPGWLGICANIKEVDRPDGSVQHQARYNPSRCIEMHCQSTQCVCRNGAERDVSPVNIFYDLYIERNWRHGFIPYTQTQLKKGLKVFDRPIARTDAELALKIWYANPDSPQVPPQLARRLTAGSDRDFAREAFFIRRHGTYFDHENASLIVEVRNIRISRGEGRDLIQDLQDVQQGIEVTHESDEKKAAEAMKRERRKNAEVRKLAKLLAGHIERGERVNTVTGLMLMGKPDDFKLAVREEAERIVKIRADKTKKKAASEAQISLFDLAGSEAQHENDQ